MSNDRAIFDFHKAIASYADSVSGSLTYIARHTDAETYVVKARLQLHGSGMLPEPRQFKSAEIIAEVFHLSSLGQDLAGVIQAALNGRIVTPRGEFAFPATVTGSRAALFLPLHPEVLAQQTRVGVLQIRGSDQLGHWRNDRLDWDLRSASTPYDSLNELSMDFGLGGIVENAVIFEAVAPSVVQVNLDSRVVEDKAEIGVFAFRDLERSRISIGYRIFDKGTVVNRGTVGGDTLVWDIEDARAVGATQIAVPPAALVNCYARYDDITYHSGWIADPTLVQNPRRSAYERFDPRLEKLIELLGAKEKRFSREFESAVACLLWMLGFNTCNLGGQKNLQDGPDVIGMTPEGHVVVVECTIGGLKTESKMARLLQRTALVRDQLAKSSHQHLRILPVMASALPLAEIQSEIDEARSSGVYVLCAENISEAIHRTLVPPRADALFVEAEQNLAAGIEALAVGNSLQ